MNCFRSFLLILFSFCILCFIKDEALSDTIISSDITTNTTWNLAGSPYIVTIPLKVGSTLNPTLTIEAGVTVKFQANTTFRIGYNEDFGGGPRPAYLKILGSPTAPVLLTADSPNPTKGFWVGIDMRAGLTLLPSIIQYAQIEYAGSAIRIEQVAPEIHSCTFRNSFRGIDAYGPLVLNTYQNSFIGNNAGVTTVTNATISSLFSWWDHISGPSGGGGGSGQSISSGVKFEPWLESIPIYTNELISGSFVNKTFNPNGGINNHVNFSSAATANWTFTYVNSSSQVVRTFTGTGQSTNIVWDGRNNSGILQSSGTYTYRIQSSGSSTATGKAIMILTQTPAISAATVNPAFISPDNDGIQETTTITANFNFDGGQWTVKVKNPGGTAIRTTTASGLAFSWVWDGKDTGGTVQPDAIYTVEFNVIDDAANVTTTKTATLDMTDPVAAITYPTLNLVASNIYQTSTIGITGTATDLNFFRWWVYKCEPACTTLSSDTTQKTNALFYNWNTTPQSNGNLSVKLEVKDNAGNMSVFIVPISVGNFSMTQNVRQINPSAGQTVSYTAVIPFSLNAIVFIKNLSGQSIRTVFNGPANPGAPPFVFNGRDNSNNILNDGPYFVVVNITKDAYNYTWDETNQYIGGAGGGVQPSPSTVWDPFNNLPLTLSLTLAEPRRVSVAMSNTALANANCSPPTVCLLNWEYQPSGIFTYVWTGVDNQGILRPDLRNYGIWGTQANFSKNAVVIFGTKPKITNLIVSPPLYNPSLGNQNINFTLTTYLSQPANVTITIFNQASRSILRTITQNSVAAGSVSIPWDGKADNGMRVSGDAYTITVTATDSTGQQVTARALTQVRY